jgi:hypothetical protein
MGWLKRAAGWTIDTFLPIQRTYFHPVVWANLGFVGRLLARMTKSDRPPLLILSMPRSGSSWVGKMLGYAKSALYLREPINQSVLEHTDLPTLYEVFSERTASKVRPPARDVFNEYPAFDRPIVQQPEKWGLVDRRQKQVVVKEVNPFLLSWLLDSFDFRILYLVRHPAGVAGSYDRLGWGEDMLQSLPKVGKIIPESHKNTFWPCHGALQAVASNSVVHTLSERDEIECKFVRYEDLCRKPVKGFRRLFEFAELPFTDEDLDRIERHSTSTNEHRNETYGTRRNSAEMVDTWRDEIERDHRRELKAAYLYYEPPFYTEERCWPETENLDPGTLQLDS